MSLFEEEIKKVVESQAKFKEAFILEQMKPFFKLDKKTGTITVTEQLSFRLAEIEDCKQDYEKKLIDAMRVIISRQIGTTTKEQCIQLFNELKKELGFE